MNIKLSVQRSVRETFLLTLALVLAIFVAACSKNANTGNSSNSASSSNSSTSTPAIVKPAGSTPTDALKAYYDAAKRKDFDTVKRYLSRGTMEMMDGIAKSQNKTIDQMFKENADKDAGMPAPEFSNEKISGDTATVDIKAPNQPVITMDMVKEDGDWKLAVDKMMGGMMKPPADEHHESGNENDKESGNDNH